METPSATPPPCPPKAKTIFRKQQRDRFTVLPNALLQDKTLSFRARGILVQMLSMPEHWQTYQVWLQKQGTEGREAIRAAIQELITAGYVTRRPGRDEDGRIRGHVWSWHAEPLAPELRNVHRMTGSRQAGNPSDGKPAAIKNSEKKESTLENIETGQAPARVSKGTPGNGVVLFPEGEPDSGTKEQQLARLPMPDGCLSQREFDDLLSRKWLLQIHQYRPDLYDEFCRNKWHQWRDDLGKWVPIRDLAAYLGALERKITKAKKDLSKPGARRRRSRAADRRQADDDVRVF